MAVTLSVVDVSTAEIEIARVGVGVMIIPVIAVAPAIVHDAETVPDAAPGVPVQTTVPAVATTCPVEVTVPGACANIIEASAQARINFIIPSCKKKGYEEEGPKFAA